MKIATPVCRRISFRFLLKLLSAFLLLLAPAAQSLPAQSSTATTTTVAASPTTITLGAKVSFTATVTAATGTPSGLVTFFDGNTPLGSATLTNVAGQMQASFQTYLLSAAGSPHSITAVYQGDSTHTGSTSSASSETVNPRASTTGVVLNPTTVVVGQSSTATVTLTDSGTVPPGTADTFSTTGAPAAGRTGFTATLFANTLVLVAGGTDASNSVLNSAEIYSFLGAGFSATGTLNTARTGAVAVLLPTGKILIAGGSSNGAANGALNTAELYDSSAGTFAFTTQNLTAARFGATATLLNNGKILIAGGENNGGVLNSAELYDPVADTFTATGNLNTARSGMSATLLGTGKVLIAGGSSDGTANGALDTAELFDPAGNSGAGTFTAISGPGSTLVANRWQPESALLPSGKVLIAGGQNSGGAFASADLYDPVANTFTASNHSMAQPRANGSAISLPNGMVLLAGGTTSQAVDLYDPDSDKFNTTGSLQQSDNGLIATLLNNGDVLVVGLTTAVTPASDTELYAPSFNPAGAVSVTSSEATDTISGACVLTPSTSTTSTCTSTVTPVNVATSPHTITGTYPADTIHSTSNNTASLTVNKADTSSTQTSSVNPAVFGQSITFTVTVSAVAPGSGTPTGTVTFKDGGSSIGTGTLTGGVATFTTSELSVGNHTITASYGGDGNFNTSSAALAGNPQLVAKADTNTTVTSSANPSVLGQSVTFTATVSPIPPSTGIPTGSVVFLDGGSPIGFGALNGSGVATFTTSSLSLGSHPITTNTGGDSNFNGSIGTLTGTNQVVNKDNSTTTVTSSANPSVLGQSVTFTATVSAVAPGVGTPSGTVTFLDNGSPVGSGSLNGSGVATFSTSALSLGNHPITTSYGGDSNFNGSTGTLTGTNQVVNKANPSVAVTSSLNPSVFGQSVTFTATLTAAAPGTGTPTGMVTFLDGGSSIGTGTLSAGVATFTTSALAVGNHTITANYGGDANFNTGSGSLTGNPQVVNKADTSATQTSSLNPSVFGQSITFTATVSAVAPGAGTPTGTVTFKDGGSSIGTGTLSGGVATFTTSSLPVGNHTITESYGGDGNFNTSTGSLTGNPQVVFKADTSTGVTSSLNPSVFGQSVTFTATVSPVAPGAGTPTGTVTFLDGGSPVGTGTLSGGIATFTTSALSIGSHPITTSYGGDGSFNGSTGTLTGTNQVVNKANSATTVTSSANPSVLGQSVTFTATVSPVAPGAGTPTGTVTFLDGGSPVGTGTLSGGIATFTTSALTIGNHPITTSYGGDSNFNGSTGTLTGTNQVVNKADSSTAVTSSQNPSALGQSVTFTATVSAVAPGVGTPTGSVTFKDGGSSIGTGTLSGGVATLSTSSLTAGSHTITATYGGDSNFNGSTGSLTGNPQVVLTPPLISKSFGPSAIPANGVSTMTITITNPAANTAALAGLAFTDSFPAGLVVATPNGLTNSCGGTATAAAGSGTLTLAGGTVATNSSCTVNVNVTSGTMGTFVNTTGAVSSTSGGTGGTASATLNVALPPVIAKAFGASTIPLNGTTSLSFTITNPASNTISLAGVGFTDSLPAGLQVATPNGLSGSCGGGSITAAPGSSSVSLSGATLPASGNCTFAVNVTGTSAGAKVNAVTVNSTTGGAGNTSTASMTVIGPPTLQKAFGAASVNLSASTSLTFTVTNPNVSNSLSSIAFTDTLPAGLVVATPNALTGSCGGGTITAVAGSGTVALTGATLAGGANCTFSVNVTAIAGGVQNNTTSTISSTEGGVGGTASASVSVLVADLIVTKSHSVTFKQGLTGATYTITASNRGAAPTVGTVTVTDTLPSSLTATAISGTGWTCTLAATSCSRSDALANGASYPPITLTVNVSGTAPTSVTNTAVVAGGGEVITDNDTATDVTPITVVPPDFSITVGTAGETVKAGQLASFSFTVTPLNNVPVSTPITLSVTGLAPRTSAAFVPSSVTPGLIAATDTLVITTTLSDPFLAQNLDRIEPSRKIPALRLAAFDLLRDPARFPLGSLAAFALLLVGLGLLQRGRWQPRTIRLLLLLGLSCCGLGLYGCASAQNFRKLGTPPGTYTITVTATLANGNVQHSDTVTLTVTP
ncbi:MAG TPA: Ig-like domain repeat protein [Candidatus Acidoferrum sp.]|nr:Ig-like domain repeat protein [Candidatus Acidoferrum sp.]